MLDSCGITVERRDSMRVAPQRAEQLRSQRANGASTTYRQAPTCGNPRCEGECRLCCADSASAALVPDEAGDEEARLARAIVKAHRHAVKASPTPAIVKRDGTIVRSASDMRRDVRRAKIGRQATSDAASFRRTMSADERRDPRVRVEGDATIVPST